MMKRKDCDNQLIGPRRPVRLWPVTAGCVLVLCCALQVQAGSIRLHSKALIDHDPIRLGDLVLLEGFSADQTALLKELVVSDAPGSGQDKIVTLTEVRSQLLAAGTNMAEVCLKGASRCIVRRPTELPVLSEDKPNSLPVSGSGERTLRSHIAKFIEERLVDYGGSVALDFERATAPLLMLSEPEYTFDIETRTSRRLGNIQLLVTIGHGQGQPKTHRVPVSASLKKEVVVALNSIIRGRIIARSDVMLEERVFTKLDKIGMTDPASVIGQEARRVLGVGEMLTSADIKSKILVKRNDLLSVRSINGGIAIESTATALLDGALGDIIEVRNEASEKTFWARVTGLRQAEALAGPGNYAAAARRDGGGA